MQFKTSSVNNEINKLIFRSVGWISILQFFGLFFALPLNFMLNASDDQRDYIELTNLFHSHFGVQVVFMLGIPVLMSLFLFRFLQVRQYSDFIHSLPLKRESIFHRFTLTGLFYLLLPIAMNTLILALMYRPFQLYDYFSFGELFQWMELMLLFHVLLYMTGVFMAAVAGITAVQGALTYIVLLLPLGMLILVAYNLPFFLYGFSIEFLLDTKLESFSPLVLIAMLQTMSVSTAEILLYSLLTIVLYFIALIAYKHRKAESVSHALVFPFLKPVFKYGVTFCMMLLSGMYFGQIQGNASWLITGYITGAVIGYIAAEMVLQKSWRITIHLKGFFIYITVITAVIVLFNMDLLNYDRRVPQMEEISAVQLTDNYYMYKNNMETDSEMAMYERENITLVRNLHELIIANEKTEKDADPNTSVFILYHLKSGDTVARFYELNESVYRQQLKAINESSEYKKVYNDIFKISAEDLRHLSISSSHNISKSADIQDKALVLEAVEALKRDIEETSYEDGRAPTQAISYINIRYGEGHQYVHVEWMPYYQHFPEFLRKHGLYEQARATAEDIDYVLVAKKNEISLDTKLYYEHDEILQIMQKSEQTVKITNKEEITQLLNTTTYHDDKDYVVGYVYNDRSIEIREIKFEQVPAFLTD